MAYKTEYGYVMARKRRKDRAKKIAEQKISTKGPTGQTDTVPELEWFPLQTLKSDPMPGIVWENNENIVEAFAERIQENMFQILRMPTGVGKTSIIVHTIAMLQKLNGEPQPFIVVMPRAVKQKRGWARTIQAWNLAHPENRVEPLMFETPDRFANICKNDKSLVQLVKGMPRNTIIVIDEVHGYKNPTSKRAKTLLRLKKFKKIGLSATPLTNDVIKDAISYLVQAGLYTSKTNFQNVSGLNKLLGMYNEYLVYNEDGTVNTQLWPYYNTMIKQLNDVIFAPEFEVSSIDMPEVKKHVVQLDFDKRLESQIESIFEANKKGAFDSAIDVMMCIIETLGNSEVRLDKLVELIRKPGVVQPLVFYWHNVTLDALMARLDDEGIKYAVINGESNLERVNFNKDQVLLIQYQAGSEGIEMKKSNTTIFYQNQYSFARFEQAEGRNVRRGMSHDVTQYSIVAHHKTDVKIFETLMNRKQVSEETLAQMIVKIGQEK